MKPHDMGKSLILLAAVKMVSIMHGEKYTNDLKSVPLLRNSFLVNHNVVRSYQIAAAG
jgi:hypothetical protein